MGSLLRDILASLSAVGALYLGPPLLVLAWLHLAFGGRILGDPSDVPTGAVCVMGARVYGPGDPSPVALQRVEAAAALGGQGRVFVVSGDEANQREASELASELGRRLGPGATVVVDLEGDSTLDNVRAMAAYRDGPVVFVSQGYHLPRTLWMARREGLDAWGLAAEDIAPQPPGVGPLEAAGIRVHRHLREGCLGLLYAVGQYERLSE